MARAKKNTQRSRQNVQFQVGVQCHAHDNPCCATWAPCLWVRCLLLRPAQIMEFKTAGNVRILIVVQGASIQCGGKLMPVISQILSEFCHFIRVMWETMYLIRLNEMLLRAHEICFERFFIVIISTHNFWEDVALIWGIANKIFNLDMTILVAWQPQYRCSISRKIIHEYEARFIKCEIPWICLFDMVKIWWNSYISSAGTTLGEAHTSLLRAGAALGKNLRYLVEGASSLRNGGVLNRISVEPAKNTVSIFERCDTKAWFLGHSYDIFHSETAIHDSHVAWQPHCLVAFPSHFSWQVQYFVKLMDYLFFFTRYSILNFAKLHSSRRNEPKKIKGLFPWSHRNGFGAKKIIVRRQTTMPVLPFFCFWPTSSRFYSKCVSFRRCTWFPAMLQTWKKVKVMSASPPISKPGAIIMVILVGSEVDKVMPVAPQIVKVFLSEKEKIFIVLCRRCNHS